MSENLIDTTSKTVLKKTKVLSTECKICGDKAIHSYCGVIACPSCKMFFKRNAQVKQVP